MQKQVEYVEVPRPPENCGAFIPPSRFEGSANGAGLPHKGFSPTVCVSREALVELVLQQDRGSVDRVLLRGVLGAHDLTPGLSSWLREIRSLLNIG